MEVLDILDFSDLVLMQEQHFELVMVIKALNVFDTIAFKPERSEVLICLKVFDFGKTFIMEVKGIVERGSLKLTISLAQFIKISLSDVDLTVFVSIRLNVDSVGFLTLDGVLKLLTHYFFGFTFVFYIWN